VERVAGEGVKTNKQLSETRRRSTAVQERVKEVGGTQVGGPRGSTKPPLGGPVNGKKRGFQRGEKVKVTLRQREGTGRLIKGLETNKGLKVTV